MKTKFFWILGLVMMLAAGPAFAGKAMQMWNCGMDDTANEEQIETQISTWLKGAREIDGGENIEASVLFPVAVNATGDTDLVLVITFPSFAEWGKFWDAYPSSDLAETEERLTYCPDSVVWESVKIQ